MKDQVDHVLLVTRRYLPHLDRMRNMILDDNIKYAEWLLSDNRITDQEYDKIIERNRDVSDMFRRFIQVVGELPPGNDDNDIPALCRHRAKLIKDARALRPENDEGDEFDQCLCELFWKHGKRSHSDQNEQQATPSN